MKLIKFHSLLQNRGLSYAISRISYPYPKMWFTTCNYCKVIPLLQKRGLSLQFVKFLSLLHKSGLLYAVFNNSFSFAKNEDCLMQFMEFLFSPITKSMDYHMQFLEFLSFLQKCGLSYGNFRNFYPFYKNVFYPMQLKEFLDFFPFSKNVDYPMQFAELLSLH